MSLRKQIIPDYSSRGKVVTGPPLKTLDPSLIPPEIQRPTGSSNWDYNKPPVIPEYVAPPAKTPPSGLRRALPSQDDVIQPSAPMSQYSPSIETFPTANNSYFLTANSSPVSVEQWSIYPAIQNVYMANFNLLSTGTVQAQEISTAQFTASTINTNLISSAIGYISTLYANSLDLDGNVLTTANNELLFNGIPLATTLSSISSLTEWSYYPAISTLYMEDNIISSFSAKDVSTIQFTGSPSTLHVSSGVLQYGSTDLGDPKTWATYPASQDVSMDGKNLTSTLNVETSTITGVSTVTFGATNILNTDASNNLLYNGQVINAGGAGNVSQWATFPAVQDVSMDGKNLTSTLNVQTSTITGVSTVTFGATNILNTDASNNLLYNGQPLSTGSGGNVSQWATFPAVQNLNMSNHSIRIYPNTSGGIPVNFTTSILDTNIVVGNQSYSVSAPSINLLPSVFNVGSIAYPTQSMGLVSASAIGIYSVQGVNIGGGVGVNITGGGNVNIAAGGALAFAGLGIINMDGGTINLGAGIINGIGGVVNLGGGALNLAAGSINMVSGNLLMTSGGIELTGGGMVIGTLGTTSNNGLTIYGLGGMQVDKIGSTNGSSILEINNVSTINGASYPPVVSTGVTSISTMNGNLTGTVRFAAGDNVGLITSPGTNTLTYQVLDNRFVKSLNGLSNVVTLEAGTNIGLNVLGSTITINQRVYQGTYYKSAPQTLTSGNTDITFDLTGSWNNTGGYITHTNGTTDFTVGIAGLYQLEFNYVCLANGATYLLTNIGKSANIDITRSPIAEQSIITNSALQASLQNYGMSVTATYYLQVGDVINLRVGNVFTGGPPTVQQVLNTFDLNTFFTWRYIS